MTTVVIVDNTDVDNELAAITACSPALSLDVAAIIVTGRFANSNRKEPIDKGGALFSDQVLDMNTRRMKGLLKRLRINAPVFSGLIPPRTIVPHAVHIDETCMDINSDRTRTNTDGVFADALNYIRNNTTGPIDFMVGGPLTELSQIMNYATLKNRLGRVFCQLGMFGFGNVTLMSGDGRTFNSACDPSATSNVLSCYPGEVYMVPTDVTKNLSVGFDTPGALRPLRVPEEVIKHYDFFYNAALKPRGERIYPHDVHAVLLAAQVINSARAKIYDFDRIRVADVDSSGIIKITPDYLTFYPARYVVKTVNSALFATSMSNAMPA